MDDDGDVFEGVDLSWRLMSEMPRDDPMEGDVYEDFDTHLAHNAEALAVPLQQQQQQRPRAEGGDVFDEIDFSAALSLAARAIVAANGQSEEGDVFEGVDISAAVALPMEGDVFDDFDSPAALGARMASSARMEPVIVAAAAAAVTASDADGGGMACSLRTTSVARNLSLPFAAAAAPYSAAASAVESPEPKEVVPSPLSLLPMSCCHSPVQCDRLHELQQRPYSPEEEACVIPPPHKPSPPSPPSPLQLQQQPELLSVLGPALDAPITRHRQPIEHTTASPSLSMPSSQSLMPDAPHTPHGIPLVFEPREAQGSSLLLPAPVPLPSPRPTSVVCKPLDQRPPPPPHLAIMPAEKMPEPTAESCIVLAPNSQSPAINRCAGRAADSPATDTRLRAARLGEPIVLSIEHMFASGDEEDDEEEIIRDSQLSADDDRQRKKRPPQGPEFGDGSAIHPGLRGDAERNGEDCKLCVSVASSSRKACRVAEPTDVEASSKRCDIGKDSSPIDVDAIDSDASSDTAKSVPSAGRRCCTTAALVQRKLDVIPCVARPCDVEDVFIGSSTTPTVAESAVRKIFRPTSSAVSDAIELASAYTARSSPPIADARSILMGGSATDKRAAEAKARRLQQVADSKARLAALVSDGRLPRWEHAGTLQAYPAFHHGEVPDAEFGKDWDAYDEHLRRVKYLSAEWLSVHAKFMTASSGGGYMGIDPDKKRQALIEDYRGSAKRGIGGAQRWACDRGLVLEDFSREVVAEFLQIASDAIENGYSKTHPLLRFVMATPDGRALLGRLVVLFEYKNMTNFARIAVARCGNCAVGEGRRMTDGQHRGVEPMYPKETCRPCERCVPCPRLAHVAQTLITMCVFGANVDYLVYTIVPDSIGDVTYGRELEIESRTVFAAIFRVSFVRGDEGKQVFWNFASTEFEEFGAQVFSPPEKDPEFAAARRTRRTPDACEEFASMSHAARAFMAPDQVGVNLETGARTVSYSSPWLPGAVVDLVYYAPARVVESRLEAIARECILSARKASAAASAR
jgi:hypothetical protein